MRYFLDTEFNQNVDPVQLISLAIVAEDGREYYAVSSEFSEDACDDWLKKNVLPLVDVRNPDTYEGNPMSRITLSRMKKEIEVFTAGDEKCEFWGYYADYDWFLFTRLWGFLNMKRFPMLCLDVKQYAIHLGVRNLPPVFQPEHHALVDARWTKRAFEFLKDGR